MSVCVTGGGHNAADSEDGKIWRDLSLTNYKNAASQKLKMQKQKSKLKQIPTTSQC